MFTSTPRPRKWPIGTNRPLAEFGLSGRILMENASRDALHVLKTFGPLRDKSAIIFAGPGNNGGDGFCPGPTSVQSRGQDLDPARPANRHEYTDDSAYHLHLAEKWASPARTCRNTSWISCPRSTWSSTPCLAPDSHRQPAPVKSNPGSSPSTARIPLSSP